MGETGPEEYIRSTAGHEGLRLQLQLRTGSTGLFEDKNKKRGVECVLIIDVHSVTWRT